MQDPAKDTGWVAYAAGHPAATLYHGRAFLDAIQEAFGFMSFVVQAREPSGQLTGILPLVRQPGLGSGPRLVALPYCNHGGALAEDPGTAVLLARRAGELGRALGCSSVEIRDHQSLDLDWPVHTQKVLMLLELPDSQSALDRQLGAKLRSQCRRAGKAGARFLTGGAELLGEFYTVFASNMRDLGTPVYPLRWFEVLARHFGPALTVALVRLDDKPVAAAVLLRWRDTLEIPWAAALARYKPLAVNMALYRGALDFAIETGAGRFDFGRSTRGAGTWRFKQQWGAQEQQIWWRSWPQAPAASEGGVSSVLRAAWQRLPLPVANRLGPVISPRLPW